MTTITDAHEVRVRAVAEAMAARPPGTTVSVRKATPTHSIRDRSYRNRSHLVDVSALDHVLSIDAERGLATVEGQVTMGELVRATLAHGLVPAVVPEFRKFTVSGLLNGEGIQSSSHRHGVFTHTLESVELVIADGSIRHVSATGDAELFEALRESLGTLGIVTAAAIRLVPARPFVRLSYRAFRARAEYLAAFRETLGTCAFHEGVIFGPSHHVLITGEFVDADSPTIRPDQSGEPYFYQCVRAAARRERAFDVVETAAYFSRSERGLWWMLECHTDFPLLTETAWGRQQLDKAFSAAYDARGFAPADDGLSVSEHQRCVINQDMGVTLERLGECVAWTERQLRVYPIWNCAVRLPEAFVASVGTTHYVDIGLYGEPMAAGFRHVRDLRALQRMADAPSLWGRSYLSVDELRAGNPSRFANYDRARAAVGADAAFLHIFDKVVWVDVSHEGEPKIPLWRLRRSFGRRWYLKPIVYPLMAVVALSKIVWRRQI